jgi:hypothetical protein
MKFFKRMSLRIGVFLILILAWEGPRLAAQSSNYTGTVDYGVRVGNREVVLVPFDSYAIPFRSGLQLEMVAARAEANPVLRRGEPGQPDSVGVAFYGTIIPIGNQLRMWYLCAGDQEKAFGFTWLRDTKWNVCYAVSTDGVNWEKPKLGLVSYGGNTQNNLVALKPTGSEVWQCLVIYEPDDPNPDRRFKMIYENRDVGDVDASDSAAYSRDGLSWTNSPRNPVIKRSFEPSGIVKYNGLYYVAGHGTGFKKRLLVVHASADFEHWTEAVSLGFRRDNIGPLRPPIPGWQTDEQIHLGASLWDRGNVILGFYGQWHGPTLESEDRRDMRMDIGLLVSHDALHYTEPIPGFKIIRAADARFPVAEFRARLVQGQSFVNLGEQTLTWYSFWGPGGADGVRLAAWPRDRFGYYSVPRLATEGQDPQKKVAPHFISCPIRLDKAETKVYLNVGELGEHSRVTVEVLDEKFQGIAGLSGADSIPLTSSGLHEQVKWRNRASLGRFNHPVRLRVNFGGLQLEHARVYAVYLQ